MWVRFPGIFPKLLDEEIWSSMGDALGRTVKVDLLSLTGLHNKFARICVEIDFAAPLIPSLTVFDLSQRVEYEHRIDDYPTLNPQPPPTSVNPPAPQQGGDDTQTSPYGPWMLPAYQRKRRPPTRNIGAHGSNRTAW